MFLLLQHSQHLVNNHQPELCEAAGSKDLACFKTFQSTSQQVGSDTSEGKESRCCNLQAYRDTVAKSLIFHSYSLNISLQGAVVLCVELLRHGGQTTQHFSAVSYKAWKKKAEAVLI